MHATYPLMPTRDQAGGMSERSVTAFGTRVNAKNQNTPTSRRATPSMAGWEEAATCAGPRGERHTVKLGNDGRVAYFGETEVPGDWVLETIPLPDSPVSLGMCCSPDGTPYVGGICDNGDVLLAWRTGEGEWESPGSGGYF